MGIIANWIEKRKEKEQNKTFFNEYKKHKEMIDNEIIKDSRNLKAEETKLLYLQKLSNIAIICFIAFRSF